MKVLTVYANPNPRSFCHAILEHFARGLKDAGHTNEVVDLYAMKFDPFSKPGTTQTGSMKRFLWKR